MAVCALTLARVFMPFAILALLLAVSTCAFTVLAIGTRAFTIPAIRALGLLYLSGLSFCFVLRLAENRNQSSRGDQQGQ
jgi:membrane protein implicated in regulation of membrane protease activity